MTIKKKYLMSKPVCKVTFKIAPEVGKQANTARILGEFNDWSPIANPMRKLKSGAFTATIDLEKGRGYQFRYLLDRNNWENDSEADDFVPSPFGDSNNSVVIV